MNKMVKKQTPDTNSILKVGGIMICTLTIAGFSALLLTEPVWFSMQSAIVPLIILLLIGSAMFSYPIAANKSADNLKIPGTIALAVLFSFLAFIATALIAWLIAVYHANA